jgi:hypothetical protein
LRAWRHFLVVKLLATIGCDIPLSLFMVHDFVFISDEDFFKIGWGPAFS